jgi:nitrate/nitrite-specific signal transduction histidine kinase
MKSIFGKVRSLRNQYALFITTVIITIVVTQLIIHYDLSNQNEDAHLINIAGRQRMLSQRIAKRVLYFQQEFKEGEIDSAIIDTLQKLIRHWEKVHLSLLNGSDEFGLSNRKSPRIDSLLNVLTPPLNAIVAACNKLIEHPDTITADYTANIISQNELHFLQTMEETVATYQREAEEKLRKIKKVELALALSSILILIMEFIFIFMPIMRTLK